jgi:two-component system response regulator
MMNEAQVDILLIEDNPDDLELTLLALRENNLANHIEVARDGKEALDFLLGRDQYEERDVANAPSVILLDLKLPKVDGLDVLREVKTNPITHAIPVVMLTSSREERDMLESYALGVNSFISKPVKFEEFIEAVRQIGFYWLLLNQRPG